LLSASHPLRITLTLFTFIHSSLEARKKITFSKFTEIKDLARSSRLQTQCSTRSGTVFDILLKLKKRLF